MIRRVGMLAFACMTAWTLPAVGEPEKTGEPAGAKEVTVTTHADSGPGSLRAALEQAGQSGQPYRITFGTNEGHFSTPRVIELTSPLPVIRSRVQIDGHIPGLLWKAYGVTIDGAASFRIFEVAPEGRLHMQGITIENGRAETGAGVLNRGHLVAQGVTLVLNRADNAGGAIANRGGEVIMINSTAVANKAIRGGAIANLEGSLRATHVTLHDNSADQGSAIFSLDDLSLGNSILTGEGVQCFHSGPSAGGFVHNIFATGDGCGEPIVTANPRLGKLGYYNGPTPTIPISGLSPAINLGDNATAVDAVGEPLKWDQRGNGDPRFARGFVDIGAFEYQSRLPTEYLVDTLADVPLRGCTEVSQANCPLDAAVELSLAGRELVPIRFLPLAFAEATVLHVTNIPDDGAEQPLVFNGEGTGGVTIVVPRPTNWRGVNGARVEVARSSGKSGN